MTKQTIGQMLLAANLIDEVQMKIALAEQQRTGKRFGSTLVDLKFIDENVLAAFLSRQIDVPCISLPHIEIPRKIVRRISGPMARQCRAVPVRVEGETLEVAMVNPTDLATIQLLQTATGLTIRPLIAPESSIDKVLERIYPTQQVDGDDTLAGRVKASAASDPNFSDLIDELGSEDFVVRLDRLEERLEQVWILLEKVLRILESRQALLNEVAAKEWTADK